jgi:hypothetical protein
MTATLPDAVQRVFDRYITTEYTTVDRAGQPITWPVTPYYERGATSIDVTTGLGYPKKANDARANPKVALLFSDPTGCGLDVSPQVLVQGTATIVDDDLEANRERYARESKVKLPATQSLLPPKPLQRFALWYFARLYVCVRPERVYYWEDGDPAREPQLLDAHGSWVLVPRKLVGGFELPPGSRLAALRKNARNVMRYRRIARAELERRRG